jgi:hypothetical protein
MAGMEAMVDMVTMAVAGITAVTVGMVARVVAR